ncbi:hypothetical protein ABEB36_013940 [Hypothenemus hampei]|uniref:Myb/SANT-like DNA-binding domain-containing protein n=1 Tax=Hypothenemus hampei TaxID=57062 RepID=A0ABD1E5R2_HYPHA
MEQEKGELEEFLVFGSEELSEDSFKWTHQITLYFLDLYKQYRNKVGSLEMKTLNAMFVHISNELSKITKKNITAANCSNRWKVLERGYKKFIDNNNKTGRGRHSFEYAEVLHDILGKKKNINPALLLSSETIHVQEIPMATTAPTSNYEVIQIAEDNFDDENIDPASNTPRMSSRQLKFKQNKPKKNKAYENKKLKFYVLKEIRNDRKAYYEKSIKIKEKELDLKEKELMEVIKKNELLEKLIKAKCNKCSSDFTVHM